MADPAFATFCAQVRTRHLNRKADDPRPEPPFCLADGAGTRIDGLQQAQTTLTGLLAILLGLAAAITAIWTRGTPFLVLATLTALAAIRWWLRHRMLSRLAGEWYRDAKAYPAALVMAHGSLFEPGKSVAPGSLVVDFGAQPDAANLAQAAAALGALDEQQSLPATHAHLRDVLRLDMQRARYGRVRLPKDLAGNDTTWLISLRLDRAMMPNGHLDRREWFVMARADRDESAELLPPAYWNA